MTFPVSVVVPHIRSRQRFFTQLCLPSILENNPAEVIVIPNDGTWGRPGIFRNRGAEKASQEYMIFVDDDTVLHYDAIATMMEALEKQPRDVGYVYPTVTFRVEPGVQANVSDGYVMVPPEWNREAFLASNYVSNMSLMRRKVFPGYDDTLRRLVDWDLWLTMLKNGIRGARACAHSIMDLWQIDKSVSMSMPDDEALAIVKRKHGIP